MIEAFIYLQSLIDAGALATGDISGPDGTPDCYVDLYDFAAMTGDWLYCNNPQDTECEFPVFPMTNLGVSGSRFTINGEETFLFGISYYAALGAPRDFIRRDLDDMRKFGINWIRVWATWAELKDLRDAAKLIDPECLTTASAGDDIPYVGLNGLDGYLLEAEVDFICPHRPRSTESAGQTQAQSGIYLGWMGGYGRIVPIHYQEPFRRGFTSGWEPLAADYITDAQGALDGGAAGWCLHNGRNEWDAEGNRPRRSFDMREEEGRLFNALDGEEMAALQSLSQILADGAIRIMPMGDSVTSGIYGSQVPTDRGYRIGYRYELYNMLNAAGYAFDFVGSELDGSYLFPDVANAAIPGIPSADLAYLLETGWDNRWGVQKTPGPYFETHPADVVLLLTGIAGFPNSMFKNKSLNSFKD